MERWISHLAMAFPGGPILPAVMQTAQWMNKPLELLEHCQKKHGDAFTLKILAVGNLVMFTSPDAIAQILDGDPEIFHAGEAAKLLAPLVGPSSILLLDGAPHTRQRQWLMPPFHGARMRTYADIMRDVTDDVVDAWKIDGAFALHPYLQDIALQVILRAVFGMEKDKRLGRFTKLLARALELSAAPIMLLPQTQVDFTENSPWGRFLKVLAEIDREIYSEIERRRQNGAEGRDDVLSMLLLARDESGNAMSNEELRDELVTLLVAGYETSAATMAWTFEHLLAEPRVHQKLMKELRDVVGNRPLEADRLQGLKYLDLVIKESLRLRPVLPIAVRVLKRAATVGGFELPEGTSVAPCMHLLHRRADLYPDPERFLPERWQGFEPDPFEWIPFGGGSRRCVGIAFAQYQMKVVVAEMLLRTRMKLVGAAGKAARRAITLAPAGGVRVVVEERLPRRDAHGSVAAPAADAQDSGR